MRGADLNDRLVTVAVDGGSGTTVPVAATATREPAQLAAAQAAAVTAALGDRAPEALWVSLTPPLHNDLPGQLLRHLRNAGHHVQGFIDRTTLLAAWLEAGSELVVLELARTRFSLGLAVREADGAALRRHLPVAGGEQALLDAWLRLAAQTLVQQTRFDPLHDLEHEAALRAKLPALVADAERHGQGRCVLDTGGGSVTLALTRDQLAAAAEPLLSSLGRTMQALAAAHGDAVLLVPESMLGIPGMRPALLRARFAQVYRCADDLAARAASTLAPSGAAAADGGVPYRTRVPLPTRAAPADVIAPLTLVADVPEAMATHVVYRGRVVPIPPEGLVIGRDPGTSPSLILPEGIAGLSRRHCTLRRDGGRTQVIDHSTYGTLLDGARVRGRALLPAGGVLKLGDPGIELSLVAIEAG
jgi:hypothetical protein